MNRAAQLGERGLLEALLEIWGRPAAPTLQLGPGDDAAIIRLAGEQVLTVDSVVAGQDWLADATPPTAIGHRAAAVNLSDLAAMGAAPRYLLVALELNRDDDVDDVLEAAVGLGQLCDAHGVQVIGGDIGIGDGPQRWTVTAVGEQLDGALRRDAARADDRVWLVGDVGRASLGLHALLHGRDDPPLRGCVAAHLRPRPLIAAGRLLAQLSGPIAAIDVSDGLWLDASRLAAASGCSLRIQVPRPSWMSPTLEKLCTEIGWDWRQGCATGGDDYALLVTAPWEIDVAAALRGVPEAVAAVAVGVVEEGEGVELDVDSRRLIGPPQGYLHGNA